jgi:O-antigen ligase
VTLRAVFIFQVLLWGLELLQLFGMNLRPSDIERLLIWKGAIRAWLVHPWFGWGLDNFLGGFRANRGLEYIDSIALNGNQLSMQGDSHNILLQILVTTGLFGLAIFLFLLRELYWFLEDRKKLSNYHKTVRACCYGLFAASLVEPVPFSAWCLLAMFLGSIA